MNIAELISNHLKSDKPFVVPAKKEKKERQPRNSIDWDLIDRAVFKAALHFSFSGADINKFLRTCPTFVKANDAKNRALISNSLESLHARCLVKVVGQGRDRYIQAANGASMTSYFSRGELPPPATVFRRTTVTEEMTQEQINSGVIIADSDDEIDYDDITEDLSVE